jgi:hypothetical protein
MDIIHNFYANSSSILRKFFFLRRTVFNILLIYGMFDHLILKLSSLLFMTINVMFE